MFPMSFSSPFTHCFSSQVFNTEDESRNLKPIFNFENTINAQRAAKQASTAAAATGPSAIQPTPTAAS